MSYMLASAMPQNSLDIIDGFFTGILTILGSFTILMVLFTVVLPILIIILKLTLPIITAVHAKRKGYSPVGFYLYGLLSFVIAMGVIILAQPKVKEEEVAKISEEDEIAEIKSYYEAGSISYTEMCQRIDKIKMRKYRK